MPAASSIQINDGQATPVVHTFSPLGPDPKDARKFWFEEPSAISALGNLKFAVSVQRQLGVAAKMSANERVARVKVEFHLPVLETLNASTYSGITPAPTVAYVCRAFVELVIPERATLQNRVDLRTYVSNLVSRALFTPVVDNLQGYY